LTSIQGQAGYSIDFIANTTRDDFDGAKRLDRIEHKFNSNLLTKYNFDMGYFKDPYDQSNTMLRLDKVQQEGYDNNQDEVVPPYTFSYHGNTHPKPESLEFDHWGFYNGGGNFVVYLDSACNAYNNAHYGRREPIESYALQGMLEQVNYPTGAKTTIEYEMHSYGNFSGGKVYRVTDIDTLNYQSATYISGTSGTMSETYSFTLDSTRLVRFHWDSPIPISNMPMNYMLLFESANCTDQVFEFLDTEYPYKYMTLEAGTYYVEFGL
jgi:hypothetical protein